MTALFGFEAVSIQNYILTTGKLKGMIGGSELVNRLGESYFPQAVADLGWEMDKVVWPARTSGGALTLFFPDPEKARQFQTYWTALVQKKAPGKDGGDAVVMETNPALREALAELKKIVGARESKKGSAACILEELQRLEDETSAHAARIRDLIEKLN